MAKSQLRSKRKATGGRYRSARKQKSRELGSDPTFSRLGKRSTRQDRSRGGYIKTRVIHEDTANVYVPSTKKYEKLKIETIVSNPANRNFVRRNIITKGTIIKTQKGNARITSRPAQDGMVNAVLVK
jgi:small subunit ribosomal protein S8e